MGKTNILQHKSWHVYSEKNRERVRRDEEKAKQEEEKKAQRALAAEQEARLDHLRANCSSSTADGYSDRKLKQHALKGNPEREAEERIAKERLESRFTMYLGGNRDGKMKAPWYATSDYGRASTKSQSERRKKLEDPLESIKKSLSESEKDSNSINSKPHGEKQLNASFNAVERLRLERLQREAQERRRTDELLGIHMPKSSVERHLQNDNYYHSQFNPQNTRRNRSRFNPY